MHMVSHRKLQSLQDVDARQLLVNPLVPCITERWDEAD